MLMQFVPAAGRPASLRIVLPMPVLLLPNKRVLVVSSNFCVEAHSFWIVEGAQP